MDYIGVKDDAGGGKNCTYKTHKAPVKLSSSTPGFFTGRMPYPSLKRKAKCNA